MQEGDSLSDFAFQGENVIECLHVLVLLCLHCSCYFNFFNCVFFR